MRTSLAIGIGIACFGLGAFTMKLVDGGGGDDRNSKSPTGSEVSVRGVNGLDGRVELSGNGRGSGRELPSTAQLLDVLDLLDDHASARDLEPMLRGMNSENLRELLFQIEREGVAPAREKAMGLVSQFFGRSDPHAALEFATDRKTQHLCDGAVEAAIAALVRESPDDALAAVREIKFFRTKYRAMTQLIATMSNAEPDVLRSWLDQEDLKNYVERGDGMKALLRGLAARSPLEAAAFVESLKRGKGRSLGIGGVAEIWGQSDPAAAVAWAKTLEGDERRMAMGDLMSGMVVKDLEGAFALLEQSEGRERSEMIGPIAKHLAQSDPEKAMAWAATLEDPGDLDEALTQIGELGISEEDPGRMLDLIGRLPEMDQRYAEEQFLSTWLYQDREAAVAWVEAIEDPQEKRAKVGRLIDSLAYHDPRAAVEMIGRFAESGSGASRRIEDAYRTFAHQDLEAAREAADALNDGPLKLKAMDAVVGAWAGFDPAEAADFVLENYAPGPEQRAVIDSVSGQWVGRDAEGALAWAASLDGPSRVAASDQMIVNLAYSGKLGMAQEALIQLFREHPEEASKSGRLENAIAGIMDNAGKADPQAGIEIINLLPTEQAQASATNRLVMHWAGAEPEEARAWVEQLEPGIVRDRAANGVVWGGDTNYRAEIFELAISIQGDQLRSQALQQAIKAWSGENSEAARVGIEESNLNDSERQSLLDLLE